MAIFNRILLGRDMELQVPDILATGEVFGKAKASCEAVAHAALPFSITRATIAAVPEVYNLARKRLISELNAVRAVMFDAGGTLVHLDSNRICSQISDGLGIPVDSDRFPQAQTLAWTKIQHLMGNGSAEKLRLEYYAALLPDLGVPGDMVPAAIDLVLKLLEVEMLWSRTLESTASVLSALKERGLILAVVSNSDGRVESALRHVGLADCFEFILDSFVVGIEKPDPRIFELAAHRAGLAPNEAAYVGDLYSVDVVGARRAGMIPVLYDPHDLHPKADCLRIRDLGELPALVSG